MKLGVLGLVLGWFCMAAVGQTLPETQPDNSQTNGIEENTRTNSFILNTPTAIEESVEDEDTSPTIRIRYPNDPIPAVEVAEPKPFKNGIRVSSEPPPGFEDLSAMQMTEVDVYFGNRFIASTLAEYDIATLTFLMLDDVVPAIPHVLDASLIKQALTGPLANNANVLCRRGRRVEGCGILKPDIAGIVFDDSQFRVDVFVNPLQLAAQPIFLSKFLPPSTAEFSNLHAFNMSVAGAQDSGDVFALSGTSLFANKQSRVRAQYDFTTNQSVSLESVAWQKDQRGWAYEAGSFKSLGRSVAFVNEQDLIGARASTTLNTRVDLDTAEGSPIYLFLDQRTRVDILKDDDLVSTGFYEAGNQQLDTSRLPDGAYPITVRILDSPTGFREEIFFFVRSAQIPPKDQPLYTFELGSIAETRNESLPQWQNEAWLRAGTSQRIKDQLGLEGELIHANGQTLLQGGAFWFAPGWQWQSSLMLTSEGDSGFSLRSLYQQQQFSLNADFRRVVADDITNTLEYDLIPETFSQGSLSAGFPALTGQWLVRSQWESRGGDHNESYGVSYFRPIHRKGNATIDLDVSASKTNSDVFVRIGANMRWRQSQYDFSASPRIQHSDVNAEADTQLLLNARVTRYDQTQSIDQLRTSAILNQDIESTVLGARIEADSTLGSADFELNYINGDEVSGLGYSGNARFSAVNQGNRTAWGGKRRDLAGVIIEVDEAAGDNAQFDVLVNGQQSVGRVQPGRPALVTLRPYETYSVGLAARGATFVDLDESIKTFTVYPGNVERLTFSAKQVFVLVARAVDEQGNVVANAKIRNAGGFAATDEQGWFQVESGFDKPLLFARRGEAPCYVAIDTTLAEDGLLVLDQVVCVQDLNSTTPNDKVTIPESP